MSLRSTLSVPNRSATTSLATLLGISNDSTIEHHHCHEVEYEHIPHDLPEPCYIFVRWKQPTEQWGRENLENTRIHTITGHRGSQHSTISESPGSKSSRMSKMSSRGMF